MEELLKALDEVASGFLERLSSSRSEEELLRLKADYLGRRGSIRVLMSRMSELSPDERRVFGARVNELKGMVERELERALDRMRERRLLEEEERTRLDVSLPGCGRPFGGRHPVSLVWDEAVEIFLGMGFDVEYGPEMEDDFHNFEALNIPRDHPARDMQDTFYFDADFLLRTHTSPVEIRAMRRRGAPLRIISPGRVYRRDSDPTHSPMFHQLEGLLVDEGVSLGDLKGVLSEFAHRMFGRGLDVRFRPSYFPFTEPSLEVDIQCSSCMGSGCRVCKGSGWLEILGAGMTHPKVLEFGGIDPRRFRGFAWGMGLDRVAMLKFGITDLRLLFENDFRFLSSARGE